MKSTILLMISGIALAGCGQSGNAPNASAGSNVQAGPGNSQVPSNAVQNAAASAPAAGSPRATSATPDAATAEASRTDGRAYRRGRCSLTVGNRNYINGDCFYEMQPEGSFFIREAGGSDEYYFAQVDVDGSATGIGNWNGIARARRAHDSLGDLTKNGACWANSGAEVCAFAD